MLLVAQVLDPDSLAQILALPPKICEIWGNLLYHEAS